MGPRPWSCVFVQLAMDSEFWAERVHHLAAAWTASGGKGAPCIATAAADAIQGALGHEQELGQGTSDSRRIQANRDGRQAKKRQTLGVRTRKASSSQSFSPFLFRQRSWRWKREGQRKIQRPIRSGALLQLGVRERTLCRCGPGGECKGPVKRIHKCRIVFHHRRRMRVAGLDEPWDWQKKVHADLLLAGSSAWGSDHVQNVFHKFIRSLFWSLVEGRRAVVAVNALGFRVECIATGCSFCVGLQGASLLGNLTVVCPAALA